MSHPITFNFNKIHTLDRFYKVCKEKIGLPEYFGKNLDALWDSLTGYINLPVSIKFINLTPFHLDRFAGVIQVFEDAAKELQDDFKFNYEEKEYDDDAG